MKDKISMQDIEDNIVDTEIVKHITKSGKVLRWAVLTTQSGFAVVGKPSATINERNDNKEIGEKVAIDNSKSEMWALMGYELAQKRHYLRELNPEKILELGKYKLVTDVTPILYEELNYSNKAQLGELSIIKGINLPNQYTEKGEEIDMSLVVVYSWKLDINGKEYGAFSTFNKDFENHEDALKALYEAILIQVYETVKHVLEK